MILEIDDLTKRFGGIRAIDGVSFDLKENEITGVIGPNGAGKTTLFNLISGFYKPDRGTIILGGEHIEGRPAHEVARAGIGRTFQIARPFNDLTVWENLLVSNYDLPQDERAERIEWILDILDLSEKRRTKAGHLSGGQQTLLEIGRVFMLDPDVILLDEPAAGVNPKLVDRIAKLIEETKDERTYMLVEHDITLISRLCERVIVLNEGRVMADGSIDEIREDPAVRRAYLGEGA